MVKAKKDIKIKDKKGQNANQPFDFSQDSYLERTSRPIYAIVLLLPLIIFYEWGTFHFHTDVAKDVAQRITAFVWLQNLLEPLGYGGKFAWVAPPLAVVAILLAQQITSGKKWHFIPGDILPMTIECVLLAVPLVVLSLFLNSWAVPQVDVDRLSSAAVHTGGSQSPSYLAIADGSPSSLSAEPSIDRSDSPVIAQIVMAIGAGIYEELVFRLILICVLMVLFEDVLRLPYKNAIVLSVLFSAALFSAHHHIDFLTGRPYEAEPFNMTEFIFRTIAGVYFAALFAIRGFGITAGTHAFYDIIAVSITARFF
ncbi:MAG: CPBP family intramembrane metalloprotease [Phycisphaerales bacterium]|nr:MAG: CPBP family intramembrane metalloprotease [Phycisphaerales bacterium]